VRPEFDPHFQARLPHIFAVRDLISNVFNYPTLAECYKLAALNCTQQLEQRKM